MIDHVSMLETLRRLGFYVSGPNRRGRWRGEKTVGEGSAAYVVRVVWGPDSNPARTDYMVAEQVAREWAGTGGAECSEGFAQFFPVKLLDLFVEHATWLLTGAWAAPQPKAAPESTR